MKTTEEKIREIPAEIYAEGSPVGELYLIRKLTERGREGRIIGEYYDATQDTIKKFILAAHPDYAVGMVYPHPPCKGEITEEIQAKVNQCLRHSFIARARQMSIEKNEAIASYNEAKMPQAIGQTVMVVRGRKHIGQSGEIFWTGADSFSRGYESQGMYEIRLIWNQMDKLFFPESSVSDRIGVRMPDGTKFFVATKNCQVIDGFVEAKMPALEDIAKAIAEFDRYTTSMLYNQA